MAEEQEAPAEGGEEGGEAAAPKKKKFGLIEIAFGLQLVMMIACAGLIAKATLFAKQQHFTHDQMKERAIASVSDKISDVKTLNLEEFIVNRVGRYTYKASIEVEVSNSKTSDILQNRMPIVKAKVLDVLNKQTLRDIKSTQGKLQLKDSIRETLNNELEAQGELEGIVREVYFSDFLMI